MIQDKSSSSSQHTPKRITVYGAAERAVEMVRRDTNLHIDLYERDWFRVDRVRQFVREAGIEDRISVRHQEALRLVGDAWRSTSSRRSA